MNNKFFTALVIGVISVYAGLSLVSALSSNSASVISGAVVRLLPLFAIVAIVVPKAGIGLLAITTCSADLLKRLMVLDGQISTVDIAKVLLLPPVLMTGLILGGLIQCLTNAKRPVILLLIFSVLWNVVLLSKLMLAGSMENREIQAFINEAIYVHLIWLIPHWILTLGWNKSDVIRPFFVGGILVCLYGLWQVFFGITDMEYEYIMSGRTSLIHEWRPTWMRPFSTLSSVHGYSMTTVLVLGLVYYNFQLKVRKIHYLWLIIISMAVLTSMVRTAWLAAVLLLIFYIVVKWRAGFYLLFTAGVLAFGALLMLAEDIRDDLDFYQDQVEMIAGATDTKIGRMAQVSTYSQRLQGFSNLRNNKDMRRLFGYRGDTESKNLYSHDPITTAVRDYGLIPVGALAVGLFFIIKYLFRRIIILRDKKKKNKCAFLLALPIAVMASGSISGGHMGVSPINTFWCVIVGLLCVELISVSGPEVRTGK